MEPKLSNTHSAKSDLCSPKANEVEFINEEEEAIRRETT
jgi:hypothetical protein